MKKRKLLALLMATVLVATGIPLDTFAMRENEEVEVQTSGSELYDVEKASEESICTVEGVVGGCVKFNASTGTIVSCEKSVTKVVIPEVIDGVKVEDIADRAFWGCNNLTSIELPISLARIGTYAFYGCTGLTSIELPVSVKSIGYGVFSGCDNLKMIEYKGDIEDWLSSDLGISDLGIDIKIGGKVLSTISEIELSSKITRIGNYAFSGFENLKSIKIPASVTSIGYGVFLDCENLNVIEYNGTMEEWFGINFDSSFYSSGIDVKIEGKLLSTIDEVELSSKATKIGNYAFSGCSSLTSIKLPTSVTSIGESAFSGCSGLLNVILPANLTTIEEYAFSGCSSLTSIKLPASVTSIGESAFSGCSGLLNVILPANLTTIEEYAFSGCSSLTNVKLPASVTSIGERAFSGCSSLTNVKLPANVTSIGKNAFSGCSGLLNVILPANLTTIEGYAFSGCSSLTNVKLPISVTSMGYGVFSNCENLSLIEYDGTMEEWFGIDFEQSYYGSGIGEADIKIEGELLSTIGEIELSSKIVKIGNNAFYGCSGLTSIKLPEGLASIGEGAFEGCSSLTSVKLPTSLISIGNDAFYRCSNLPSIELPEGLTSIGNYAFSGCSSLTSIKLPASVTSIGESAFSGCSGLINVILPANLTTIEEYAFSGCSSLTSIKLPTSLTNIGVYAFRGCSNLISVELSANVTSIGGGAFYDCSSLSSIELPSKLESIGDYTFYRCSSWEGIEIPASVSNIGVYAFYGCRDKLIYRGTVVEWISINFEVRNDGWRGYSYANPCSYGKNVIIEGNSLSDLKEVPSEVTHIGKGVFAGNEDLTSIKLPTNLISIGDYAFSGCSNLKDINLPDGLTRIGVYAFDNCSSLTGVELPSSLKYIGAMSFYDCSSLKKIIFKGNLPFVLTTIEDGGEAKVINEVFSGENVTIYYPSENDTWDDEKFIVYRNGYVNLKSEYGSGWSNLTWISYTGDFPDAFWKTEILPAVAIPDNKSGILVINGITGEPINNAAVKIGTKTFTTDEEGKVLTDLVGKYTISVTVGDNIKVRSTQKRLECGKYVTITIATDKDKLMISSANLEVGSEILDLMDGTVYLINKKWDKADADKKGLKSAKFVLQIEANGEPKKYQLIQNNEIVQENYDGCFEFGGYIDSSKKDTVYYTDGLESGYAVYVKVYDTDEKTAKQCLGLKIAEASSLEIKNNILNGSTKQEFSLGKKLKVTVPNEIPLIGGGTLDLGIMKNCPIKMSMDEDGMVKVAVNMGEFDTGDTGAWNQVKKDYEKLSKRALKLSNSAAAFGGTPQSFGGGMFTVKANVAGYGEGYLSEIKDGRLKINLGLIVEASAEKTFTKYAFIYFVPVYINFGGGVKLESKGLTYLQYENSKFSVEGGNLEIEPQIYAKLKGGVGAEDLLDVYASGKLGFSYLYRFAKNYQRLSMTGDAEVGLNVWIYNKPMLEINNTWVLYDSNRKNVTSAITTNSANTTYADLSGAEIISNDYLMKRNGMVRMTRARGNASESALVLDYAFQNASPMLLKAENALYLFYLDGVVGRDAQNQTALFYQKSTDGGVNWSVAVRVDGNANETADYNYDAVVSGDDVYVVWSDAGSVYGEEFINQDSEDGIHQITKEMNLMLAHIDGNTGDITTRVLKTEQADLQPHIMADENGNVHVAWLSNDVSSEDGMFSVNNEFKLLYVSSEQDYAITEMVLPAGSYPLSLDMGVLDDKISVAVNLDVDQELGTQEDRELYLWNPDHNQGLVRFTSNEVIDSVPKFASVAGSESLFWYQGGNVVYTSDGEVVRNVFTEEQPADIGQEFEVLEGADGKAAVVWTVTSLENEKGIEMYCSDFDGADWSAAYKMSDLNSEFTSKLSGYLSGDDYRIAYLGRKTEDSSIHAGINLIKPEERVDTVIGYSMEGNGQAGEVYPITLNVENKGNTVITELIVESDDGDINDSIKNLNIAPGTVEEIVYEGIVLPSEMWEVYNCNLTVKALEESDSENNMVPVSVGHPDLEVSASMDYSAGYYLASLMLKNNGIMISDAVLKVYSDEALLKQVYETEISDIAAGESIAMVLNADALDKTAESLYFVVSDKNETEIHLEDNKSLIYVGKGNGKEDKVADSTVVRIYGQSRYDTGYKVADALKEVLGVDKFEAVVVATGKNFADALAGSYLAVEKDAPILLTNGKENNIAQLHSYIRENVASNGTIYILGGEGAVPMSVDAIEGYTVKRLFGTSRYDTNVEILKEAGVTGDSIIVATGQTFADSLSASAARLPILLVKPNSSLNDVQKSFLEGMKNIYIVGGEGAVSAAYETELSEYAEVTRVYGDSRYDTSVEVAKTFVENAEEVVVASGKNFPDGLCGGPLAAALNAPLVLTRDGGTTAASGYVESNKIESGYVLGGSGALADETVVNVFSLENADEIIAK